ncbi:MAG: hypothetical protein R3F11_24940 [Verrucomicrobiales bacterium]
MSDLFDRWQALRARSGSRFAIADRAAGIAWTFADLGAALAWLPLRSGAPHFAKPLGAGFVLETLRAWRDGALFCLASRRRAARSGAPDRRYAGIAHAKLTSGSTGAPRLVLFKKAVAADADNIVATMWAARRFAEPRRDLAGALIRVFQPRPAPAAPRHPAGARRQPAARRGGSGVARPAAGRARLGAAYSSPPCGAHGSPPAPFPARPPSRSPSPLIRAALARSRARRLRPKRAPPQFSRLDRMRRHATTGRPRRAKDAAFAAPAMDGVRLSIDVDGFCRGRSAVGETRGYRSRRPISAAAFSGRATWRRSRRTAPSSARRAGDVINVATEADPAEVEHAVAALPGVACCAVFGAPSADPGARPRHRRSPGTRLKKPMTRRREAPARRCAARVEAAAPLVDRRWPQARRPRKVSRADWRRRYIARETGS